MFTYINQAHSGMRFALEQTQLYQYRRHYLSGVTSTGVSGC
jgi:hypothetical protein